MKITESLSANLLPIICVTAATVLIALKGAAIEGWGWLILLAFITAVTPSGNSAARRKAYDAGHDDGRLGVPIREGWEDFSKPDEE